MKYWVDSASSPQLTICFIHLPLWRAACFIYDSHAALHVIAFMGCRDSEIETLKKRLSATLASRPASSANSKQGQQQREHGPTQHDQGTAGRQGNSNASEEAALKVYLQRA
jgi:hypothetical protein